MNLYEIIAEIEKAFDEAVDVETGEILSEAALVYLDQLEIERDKKIENIGCWIKNLEADALALATEKKAFYERQIQAEKKAESLKKYLSSVLQGEKFVTDKVAISFRRSESVEIKDESEIPAEFVKEKIERRPDKTAIKKQLKSGERVPGAVLLERQNIQIK